MRVILDRDDIEEAIVKYVQDKILPYGDTRKVHVVQERKVSAKVTFGDDKPEKTEPLPGFSDDVQTEEVEVEETMAKTASILP